MQFVCAVNAQWSATASSTLWKLGSGTLSWVARLHGSGMSFSAASAGKVIKADAPDALQVREWSEKITRATARCKLVASNEDVWGYTESAHVYRDMADEIDAVKWWVMAQLGPQSNSPVRAALKK